MGWVRLCFTFLLILTFVDFHQCGRYGGGSSNSEIQSTVGPDNPGAPPLVALDYRTTRRSHGSTRRAVTTPRPRPRPTTRRPTTRRMTTARWIQPTTTFLRTTARRTTHRTTTRPTTRRTTTRSTTLWTTTTRPTTRRTTTSRPTTRWTTPTTRWTTKPTIRWTTPRPTIRRTTTPYRPPTRTTPRRRTSTMSVLPPRPGTDYYGKTKIKIVNKHTVIFPGYYPMPVPSYQHPGYVQTVTSYRYAPTDTGSTVLGFYLGYKLGQLTTPTYSHERFYDGYRPRYDHYEVHHYYHNSNSVPKEQNIVSNAIVGCVGDSTAVCPANTTSLCTNDGKLMCVVAIAAVSDCVDANNQRIKCVKSTISCVNNTAPECQKTDKSTIIVDVPCVSTAKIEGDIQYVNSTIIESVPPVPKTDNCTRSTVSCTNTTGTDNIQTSNCTTVTISCNATATNETKNCTITTLSCIGTVGSTNQSTNCSTRSESCFNNSTSECAKIINSTCNSNNVTQDGNKYVNGTISEAAPPVPKTDNCTRSTVSCTNTTGTDNVQTSNCTTVTISCNATTVNQTRNCTITTLSCISNVGSTNQTSNCSTRTETCFNNSTSECAKIINSTCTLDNVTQDGNKYVNGTTYGMKHLNNADDIGTTVEPITTTPVYWKWKRSVPSQSQDFCVTVLAVPARRTPSPGEDFLDEASSMFEKFIESVWHL